MVIYFRYSVDKYGQTEEYVLDMTILLALEGQTKRFDIFNASSIIIPVCDEDTTFALPGDGSVEGFARVVGKEVGQTAVDAVLRHLGVAQYISNQDCATSFTDSGANG